MTEEDMAISAEVMHTPLVPFTKLIGTVFLIISVSTAFFLSSDFIDVYCKATYIINIGSALWVSMGLILGMLAIIISNLDVTIKRIVYGLIGLVVVTYLIVVPLVSSFFWNAVYGWEVMIENLNFSIRVLAFLLLLSPAALGLYAMWGGSRFATFTAVLLTLILTSTSVSESTDWLPAVLLGVSTILWIIAANALYDIVHFSRQIRYRQESVIVENRRVLLTTLTQTVIYLGIFSVILVIFINFPAIMGFVSTPVVADSIELDSTYTYALGLTVIGVTLWVVGLLVSIPEEAVRRNMNKIIRKVRKLAGNREKHTEENKSG